MDSQNPSINHSAASSVSLLIKAEIHHQSTTWIASSASLLIGIEIHQSTA
jgi:hypothetical protein